MDCFFTNGVIGRVICQGENAALARILDDAVLLQCQPGPAHDDPLVVGLNGQIIGGQRRRKFALGELSTMDQKLFDDRWLVQVGHRHLVFQEIDQALDAHALILAVR